MNKLEYILLVIIIFSTVHNVVSKLINPMYKIWKHINSIKNDK